jgi:hypothetical protein
MMKSSFFGGCLTQHRHEETQILPETGGRSERGGELAGPAAGKGEVSPVRQFDGHQSPDKEVLQLLPGVQAKGGKDHA